MKLVKKQSKQTYKSKSGRDAHYYNYFLVLENGKCIQVKPCFKEDIKAFDTICIYER